MPRPRRRHTLLPLSLAPGWDGSIPFAVRKELADHWRYGLFFGRLTNGNDDQALNDPDSVYYQVLELARFNPKRYPLDVFLNTQNHFKRRIAVGTEDKNRDGIMDDAFLRDKNGKLVNDKRTASPETPDDLWDRVIEYLTGR
jgi:hypothetical protein